MTKDFLNHYPFIMHTADIYIDHIANMSYEVVYHGPGPRIFCGLNIIYECEIQTWKYFLQVCTMHCDQAIISCLIH